MKRGLYDDVTLNCFMTIIKLPNDFTYVYITSRFICRILQTGNRYNRCIRIILFRILLPIDMYYIDRVFP